MEPTGRTKTIHSHFTAIIFSSTPPPLRFGYNVNEKLILAYEYTWTTLKCCDCVYPINEKKLLKKPAHDEFGNKYTESLSNTITMSIAKWRECKWVDWALTLFAINPCAECLLLKAYDKIRELSVSQSEFDVVAQCINMLLSFRSFIVFCLQSGFVYNFMVVPT